MDPVLDLFRRIRSVYVKRLEAALGALHRERGDALLLQPLLDAEGDELPHRADAAVFDGGKIEVFAIESETRLQFEPVVLAPPDDPSRRMTLRPFTWDQAAVMLMADSPLDLRPFREWFVKWLSPPEGEGASTPHPVVHFMSEPQRNEHGWQFTLDLGTAPAEAARELVKLCLQSGATMVTIE